MPAFAPSRVDRAGIRSPEPRRYSAAQRTGFPSIRTNWDPLSVRVLSASFSPDTPWTGMTIGGMIRSEQEWEWPKCIRCEKLMTYVATIAHGLDGQCYYGFWCPGCGVATSYCDID